MYVPLLSIIQVLPLKIRKTLQDIASIYQKKGKKETSISVRIMKIPIRTFLVIAESSGDDILSMIGQYKLSYLCYIFAIQNKPFNLEKDKQ